MKLLIALIAISTASIISIYSYNVTTNTGTVIKLNDYRNKKIIVVNIATAGPYVSQIAEIEQFYRRHKDSVLIIGFPSNSFGNTAQSNATIKAYLITHGVTFPVMNKTDVTGTQAHPLYKWLASQTDNGSHKVIITEDFQKVLIGKHGKIRGVFGALIKPGNQFVQNSLQSN